MDDILIYSKTEDEHIRQVQIVLNILREHKLLAKLSKCAFFAPQVEYLGHIVSAHLNKHARRVLIVTIHIDCANTQ
jgi:hypothetical protein